MNQDKYAEMPFQSSSVISYIMHISEWRAFIVKGIKQNEPPMIFEWNKGSLSWI